MSDTTTGLTNRAIAERAGHLRPGMALYDYLTITDEALMLPLDEGTHIEIMVYADGSASVELLSENPRGCKRAERGTTIAEKICEVWCAWMDAQEAE